MKNVIDVHTHTVASGHAYSTVMENIEEAKKKGLEVLATTDHVGTASIGHFRNMQILPKEIDGIDILIGAELNIQNFNGDIDLPDDVLDVLDIRIASLHASQIKSGSKEDNSDAIINAMKNPYIQIIGHPGDPRFLLNTRDVVIAAKETGTLLEINNNSLDPEAVYRRGARDYIKEMALICKELEVPVIMGSDAHFCLDIGEVGFCKELLTEIDMPEHLIANSSRELFYSLLKAKEK